MRIIKIILGYLAPHKDVIAKSIIKRADTFDKSNWSNIWCEFAQNKFPKGFKDLEPFWWVEGEEVLHQQYIVLDVLNYLGQEIGYKNCFREWIKTHETNEEIEKYLNEESI